MLGDFKDGDADEQRLKRWINSMGIQGAHVTNIFENVKDGILGNKVIQHIDARAVDWTKIKRNPKNHQDRTANHGQLIKSCKAMGMDMIGIDAGALARGDQKNTINFLTTILRFYSRQ